MNGWMDGCVKMMARPVRMGDLGQGLKSPKCAKPGTWDGPFTPRSPQLSGDSQLSLPEIFNLIPIWCPQSSSPTAPACFPLAFRFLTLQTLLVAVARGWCQLLTTLPALNNFKVFAFPRGEPNLFWL